MDATRDDTEPDSTAISINLKRSERVAFKALLVYLTKKKTRAPAMAMSDATSRTSQIITGVTRPERN